MSLLPVGVIPLSGYNINNSLRLRASASAQLTRTPASASNRTTWTFSAWIKRGTLNNGEAFFGVTTSGNDNTQLRFSEATGLLSLRNEVGGGGTIDVTTTSRVFRDPSAWYHIIIVFDSTNATQANRCVMYVNGESQALSNTSTIALNETTYINSTVVHSIGYSAQNLIYFDGYLAEINFIDGQALSASSFGETNVATGVWQPVKYTGTYGTNGFYLNFSDIATTSGSNAGLGKDFSGNGNFYNTSNISVTAGATYDAMTDSPTPTSATVGNYCVLNNIALVGTSSPSGSTSNANLTATTSVGTGSGVGGTMAVNMPSGNKYYWEVTLVSGVTGAANACQLGVVENSAADGLAGAVYAYNSSDSPTYTNGDTISFAYDDAASTLYCYKNNVLAKTITSVSSSSPLIPLIRDNLAGAAIVANFNFGQRPFTYTPPTGYNRLNTFNLPTSTIVKGNSYMDATTYTGTGASRSVTNAAGFRPDFVWVKGRSGATDHALYDAVRGATNDLVCNTTAAATTQAQGLTAFNSNGFTVGTLAKMNTNAATYVGWQWQAGSSTVTNTSGSISAQVRANTTTGFSVVTYTGTGANATVGHGLGVAPAMVIVKRRDSTGNWQVRHTSITPANSIQLNLTNASAAATTVWNSTAPTSTVFSIGTSADVNANTGTYVAYCWAEIAGFSRIGSYIGNANADGPFVYTGFRPKFVLTKNINTGAVGDDWFMFDSTRNPFNLTNLQLIPNLNLAEAVGTTNVFDLVSNGFKIRGTAADTNGNGNTIIYAAFAENPFKNALAR